MSELNKNEINEENLATEVITEETIVKKKKNNTAIVLIIIIGTIATLLSFYDESSKNKDSITADKSISSSSSDYNIVTNNKMSKDAVNLFLYDFYTPEGYLYCNNIPKGSTINAVSDGVSDGTMTITYNGREIFYVEFVQWFSEDDYSFTVFGY